MTIVFDHISKQAEGRQKYSAMPRIFKSLLGVWKCGHTRSFVLEHGGHTQADRSAEACSLNLQRTSLILDIHVMVN